MTYALIEVHLHTGRFLSSSIEGLHTCSSLNIEFGGKSKLYPTSIPITTVYHQKYCNTRIEVDYRVKNTIIQK